MFRQYTDEDRARQDAVDRQTVAGNRERVLELRVDDLEERMLEVADALDILTQYITDVDTRTAAKEPPIYNPTLYDPSYGDDRACGCGHRYVRHFDSYEHNAHVGCKYCDCFDFVHPDA